ncbi:MAG: OmpA family protein [Flavobacteriaceae bacterium]|nr:OmpA family protein [Flavobacteriaceae bacterium]
MKTKTVIKLLVTFSMVFFMGTTGFGQDLGGIVKRKVKKRANTELNKTVDKGLDVITGKEETTTTKEKREDGSVIEVTRDANGNNVPIPDFINPGTAVFVDDFNTEKPGEFPSKWTLLNGTLQNSQVIALGQKEGVVQFITSSSLKPTFKNDNYLGDSFKIEVQCYFHKKGNEAYTLNLVNKNKVHGAYQITIRGDGIVPAGSSSQYARFPTKLPAGWRTVQLSFNKGVLKVFYEGYQLINIPRLNKGVDKELTEFTHLEVSALSHGSGEYDSMINYISIAHQGLPLYKKLMTEGRLVMNNINFEVNSYTLMNESYAYLDEIIEMLQQHPEVAISIQGHTDSDGTNEFNQTLSENRARTVMNYLTSKGISASRMDSLGHGEEKPVDLSGTEEAKAKNRRVEFVYKG